MAFSLSLCLQPFVAQSCISSGEGRESAGQSQAWPSRPHGRSVPLRFEIHVHIIVLTRTAPLIWGAQHTKPVQLFTRAAFEKAVFVVRGAPLVS